MNDPKVGDTVIANGSLPFKLLARLPIETPGESMTAPAGMEWVGQYENGYLAFTRTELIEEILGEVKP
jgi:hypothetical protein